MIHILSLADLIFKCRWIQRNNLFDYDRILTVEKYFTCQLGMCFKRAVNQTYLLIDNVQNMYNNVRPRRQCYDNVRKLLNKIQFIHEHAHKPPFKKVVFNQVEKKKLLHQVCFMIQDDI